MFCFINRLLLSYILLLKSLSKLNLIKVAPLFKEKVHSIVACNVEENGIIELKDFSIYNPLFGFGLFE